MRKVLLLFALLISFKSFTQTEYQKGYFINNSNEKVICLIKNIDWQYSPKNISYKLSESDNKNTLEINNIKEFSVNGERYIKFEVDIDKSRLQVNKLDTKKSPDYQKQTLFLKLLVDGEAKLFVYTEANLTTYFYSIHNENPLQLIHKKYLIDNTKIGENNQYKQQIFNSLKCEDVSSKSAENLSYNEQSFKNIFNEYNRCTDPNYTVETTKKKSHLNLNVKGGATFNSLKIPSYFFAAPSPHEFDFEISVGFQIGIELEMILPFNNDKWRIFIDPNYNNFTAETEALNNIEDTAHFKHSTIEIPIGLRHYFFLNNTSRIFINASYNFILDAGTTFTSNRFDFEYDNKTSLGFGIGYNYNDKASVEFRLKSQQDDLFPTSGYDSEYKSFVIIFAYNIL